MLSNYYTLRALASDLQSLLPGRTILSIFSQEKDELIIQFDGPHAFLVVSCRPDENTCFLHPRFVRARLNTANIMTACWNSRVSAVAIHPSDRIIRIDREAEGPLILQLFKQKSNVLRIDAESTIRDAFRNSRTLSGTKFQAPVRERIHDIARVQELMAQRPAVPVQTLLKQCLPELGPTLLHELMHRTGIAERTQSDDLDPHLRTLLATELVSLLRLLDSPQPRVYLGKEGHPAVFSILPLRHLEGFEEKHFTDLHEAIRFFVYQRRAAKGFGGSYDSLLSSLARDVERARRTLTRLDRDRDQAQRSVEYERFGRLLLSNLRAVPKGALHIAVEDSGALMNIPLDPARSLVENAQRYFEKAKRARHTLHESQRRREEYSRLVEIGERLSTAIRGTRSQKELEACRAKYQEEFEMFGLDPGTPTQEQLPFRVFTVDGGFQVLVGKSSENNDLLTLRYAKPRDLWFHARGSSGSHVVLRIASAKGEPGKRAKEEAAAIAAYYSKMRTAKVVPVAMTERKYVRKPKGSPAGTVILEREKVIFTGPALPVRKGR